MQFWLTHVAPVQPIGNLPDAFGRSPADSDVAEWWRPQWKNAVRVTPRPTSMTDLRAGAARAATLRVRMVSAPPGDRCQPMAAAWRRRTHRFTEPSPDDETHADRCRSPRRDTGGGDQQWTAGRL